MTAHGVQPFSSTARASSDPFHVPQPETWSIKTFQQTRVDPVSEFFTGTEGDQSLHLEPRRACGILLQRKSSQLLGFSSSHQSNPLTIFVCRQFLKAEIKHKVCNLSIRGSGLRPGTMQGVRSPQSTLVVLGVFALGRVCTDTCAVFLMPLTDETQHLWV